MPGELAQWELGRRQVEDEKSRMYMSALMNALQEAAQGKRFAQQQEMAERHFAESVNQQNIDNARQERAQRAQEDYYKGSLENERSAQQARANAPVEDKRNAIEKLIDDNIAKGMPRDKATSLAYRATWKPEKPEGAKTKPAMIAIAEQLVRDRPDKYKTVADALQDYRAWGLPMTTESVEYETPEGNMGKTTTTTRGGAIAPPPAKKSPLESGYTATTAKQYPNGKWKVFDTKTNAWVNW